MTGTVADALRSAGTPVTGRPCADGAAFKGCCQMLNFFASHGSAKRHLLEHGNVSGLPITMPNAIEAGRAIFGAVLKQT
jgi:hypothetical protein